ncbi:MAG TPA: hypothetical protein VN776_12580 [Terracidiphilus sp.]|nr:hypothetical protein [Terracidiphilus sp.]
MPYFEQFAVASPTKHKSGDKCAHSCRLSPPLRAVALLLAPALLVAAGCTNVRVAADPSNSSFSISPGTGSIDTNCTGCNTTSSQGTSVEQFTAMLAGGGAAAVIWSVSGGDANSGPGTITAAGQYTPPSYLTADRVQVVVTATLNATTTATSVLSVTPGFLQPLTPENAALGPNGQTTITAYLAEAGGETGISFALAGSASGSSGGQGSLGSTSCQRGAQAFTYCTVTYSAPSSIASTVVTYVVATVGASASKANAEVLLNTAGVASTPASHQAQLAAPVELGSTGGNNIDYDTQGNQVADCCGGTLGSLIEDGNGREYLLSNNHVLARSDQATVGDTIVQPGLIDNNCVPYGDGPGTASIGSLTSWLPLSSATTNADAAIAQVTAGAVDATGSILELGTRQADGTLAAAPPGISSTGGKGETASLSLNVAKSGRTTGLTCASISALALDVNVDYFTDCAETKPYVTKTFTNQLAITGNQFSDAGDSGSLVVDTANSEPVGLFFAGGVDGAGVSQGIANPAPDVLKELSAQGGGISYAFVGTADHAVSCLNYGDNTVAAAQTRTLSDFEAVRSQLALAQARMLVNPSAGILGVATGRSTDHLGEGAVLVFVDENMATAAPATVDGVRSLVIPTNARAVALGSTPQTPLEAAPAALPAAVLNAAVAVKQQVARNLMRENPAFFGVGVGQSLDNPKEAALVIYVDRKKLPPQLPATVAGLRTRYLVMDRLHVTRSYATPLQSRSHCMAHTTGRATGFGPLDLERPRSLKLN